MERSLLPRAERQQRRVTKEGNGDPGQGSDKDIVQGHPLLPTKGGQRWEGTGDHSRMATIVAGPWCPR
ncbi:hypothetical protein BHE74_00048176 [Ensete ventricosum]|nr:hypothetical protein BHE74_00048176 [Ensete ventricosum]